MNMKIIGWLGGDVDPILGLGGLHLVLGEGDLGGADSSSGFFGLFFGASLVSSDSDSGLLSFAGNLKDKAYHKVVKSCKYIIKIRTGLKLMINVMIKKIDRENCFNY
jgi:hypothetical protein